MKKRILSLLMAVLMLVTMLPVQAVAAELTASDGQEQQTEPITAFETEVDFVEDTQEPVEEEPAADEPADAAEDIQPAEDEEPADAAALAVAEESDFNFTVNNGAATITKYNGTGGDVEIPATLGNVPVTAIGSSAFSGCTSLTSMTFPVSVTKIDTYAFWNCSNLSSVTLPEKLEELNGCAFSGTALTSITIPTTLKTVYTAYADGTSSRGPFYKCEKIETVTFEEGMTAIPGFLMRDCAGLKTINWASSITSIGTYAFNYCTGLEELVIPGEIATIGDNAFSYCTGLKNVTLQEGTATIGRYAFEACTGLTGMTFPVSVTKIDTYAFWNCSNLSSVTLPEKLEELNGCAFSGTALTSITIPTTLKTVYTAYADGTSSRGPFYKCEKIETVTFEEGMTAIPGFLMRDCAGLKTINWASSITSIGTYAFNYCTGLEELVIPGEIATIGDNAFSYCTGLKNVTLQEGTATIGRYAFEACTGLTGMTFPVSVTKIDTYAFWNCSNLSSVTLPEKLEELNGCAFSGTALTSITIPTTLKTVNTAYADGTSSRGPFYKCEKIETVTFEEGTTAIPRFLMKDCVGLTYAFIPDSVTSVGESAFANCPNVVLYTKLNSAATIYAIENGLLFVATDGGTATSSKVLDRTKSRFYADVNSIQSNGYMTVTVTVSVPEDTWATISNQRVKIRIPAQTELEQSSLKVNDVLCQNFEEVDEAGKAIVIPLTERESTIRFYVKLTGQGDMAGYAALLYKEKDKSDMEIVGILNEKVVSLSITGPEVTGTNTVAVEGVAPANGAVTIQLDGQTVDTVTANKAGAYQCTVTLPDQTETAYTITASCVGADEETLTASHVVYYQAAMPVLTKFTLFVEGHGMQEVDLLKYHSQNIRPSVGYYLTLPPYRFEVAFENGESLRSVYVTSTKNNVKKVMEAKYDSETGCYVAEGYFDDDNHAYVPGNLSVEYNLPSQAIYVGDPVDWEKVGSQSDAALKNAKVNNTVTSAGNSGTIDLNDVDEELQDVVLDYVVENHDSMTTSDAAKLSELVDLAKTAKNVYSYIIPGADDEKYILALDMRDPKSYVMIVADGMEAGSAITKFRLSMAKSIDNPNYAKLFDLADTLEDMSQAATLIYKIYNIYDDHDKLCNDIAQSNTIVDKTEAMQRANELKDDRLCFTLMTTMLPLIVAGGVMTGPAILFTAMVGGMVALSNIFWQLRVSQIKGENYGINWYIDPSGVVTDAATGKPLAGVTATAYWVPAAEDKELMDQMPSDDEYGTQWEGADYSKENPQQTDGNGWYQWDVPEGWWRVKYEKPGYETAWSDWMPVPPPQMNVNIALERVYAWGDVNGDKQVTITDVECLYHVLTTSEYQGQIDKTRPDYEACLALALDINGDGTVDVYDLQRLYEYVSLGKKLEV